MTIHMLESPEVHPGNTDGTASYMPAGFSRPRQPISQIRWSIWTLAVIASCTGVIALTAIFLPGMRGVLLREDGIVEMGSVICLAGAVLGTAAAIVAWGPRLPFMLAGFLGLVELLDETSFGARLFGFQPPALYGGGELDGFHDLLILAFRLLADVSPGLGLVWVGVIVGASVAIMLVALRPAKIAGWSTGLSGYILIFLHVGLIGLAQAVDVATSSRVLSAVEEVLEFNAALVLLVYVAQQSLEATQTGP
jgi:amino acid transporter